MDTNKQLQDKTGVQGRVRYDLIEDGEVVEAVGPARQEQRQDVGQHEEQDMPQ